MSFNNLPQMVALSKICSFFCLVYYFRRIYTADGFAIYFPPFELEPIISIESSVGCSVIGKHLIVKGLMMQIDSSHLPPTETVPETPQASPPDTQQLASALAGSSAASSATSAAAGAGVNSTSTTSVDDLPLPRVIEDFFNIHIRPLALGNAMSLYENNLAVRREINRRLGLPVNVNVIRQLNFDTQTMFPSGYRVLVWYGDRSNFVLIGEQRGTGFFTDFVSRPPPPDSPFADIVATGSMDLTGAVYSSIADANQQLDALKQRWLDQHGNLSPSAALELALKALRMISLMPDADFIQTVIQLLEERGFVDLAEVIKQGLRQAKLPNHSSVR